MTLGEKLTALRGRKLWTQEEFCKRFNKRYPELSINRSQYSKWEIDYANRNLSLPHIRALCTFYSITADELIFDHIVPARLKEPKSAKSAKIQRL